MGGKGGLDNDEGLVTGEDPNHGTKPSRAFIDNIFVIDINF